MRRPEAIANRRCWITFPARLCGRVPRTLSICGFLLWADSSASGPVAGTASPTSCCTSTRGAGLRQSRTAHCAHHAGSGASSAAVRAGSAAPRTRAPYVIADASARLMSVYGNVTEPSSCAAVGSAGFCALSETEQRAQFLDQRPAPPPRFPDASSPTASGIMTLHVSPEGLKDQFPYV